MSGPIVRTGTNPKFWSNWDKAFGSAAKKKDVVTELLAEADKQVKKAAKKVDAANKAAMAKATKKAPAKKAPAKKAAVKKTTKKAAKK